jgi:hypothetical protein
MMVLLVAMFIMLAILSLVYLWLVFKHDDKFEFTPSMSRKEHMIAAIVTFLVTVLCIAFCLGGL